MYLSLSLDQDGETMRLYYHPLSSNSRRVLLTAYHLGLDLELVALDLSKGEHKAPEYLRLNPNGRVPLLVDGEFYLWESHAIMQYLADKSLEQDIYPQGISARGDVNRWLFWSASHFAPAAAFIIRERVSKRIWVWAHPTHSRLRAARRCSRRWHSFSIAILRANIGLRRTGSRWPISLSPRL